MAELSITKNLGDLKVLFNQINHVYFFTTPNLSPTNVATADYELPIVEDTVTFNTGEPDVTRVRLTTGVTWTSIVKPGDADITLQISSVEDNIFALFFHTSTQSAVTLGATIDSAVYSGSGYDGEPKKVNGGLLMTSGDNGAVIFLPNVEMYASLQIDNDVPAYINVVCTPTVDTNGVSMYIMPKRVQQSGGGGG